jgi:hypothetical protein
MDDLNHDAVQFLDSHRADSGSQQAIKVVPKQPPKLSYTEQKHEIKQDKYLLAKELNII